MANIVSISTLKDNGYEVSAIKDEAKISRAEADVKLAYFPETETFESEKAIILLHALAYSYIISKTVVASRFGAATKVSQYTIAANEEQTRKEIRGYCMARLKDYYKENDFDFCDILNIYDNLFYIG